MDIVSMMGGLSSCTGETLLERCLVFQFTKKKRRAMAFGFSFAQPKPQLAEPFLLQARRSVSF
jgi:hypothetical protein